MGSPYVTRRAATRSSVGGSIVRHHLDYPASGVRRVGTPARSVDSRHSPGRAGPDRGADPDASSLDTNRDVAGRPAPLLSRPRRHFAGGPYWTAMKRTHVLAIAIAIATIGQPPISGQQSIGLGSALRWRSIGPYRGGRVTAVAGIANQPLVYYMGATGGGVWKTDDAGTTWNNVSDGFFRTGSVGAVSVAPVESQHRLRRDGRSVPARQPVVRRRGLQIDRRRQDLDACRSARQQSDRTDQHSPDESRSRLRRRHRASLRAERGARRVSDEETAARTGRKCCSSTTRPAPRTSRWTRPTRRCSTRRTWQMLRTPWDITSTGPGGGLYKSTDGGDTWSRLTAGLPAANLGKIGVTVSPVNPQRVWATVEADDKGGVYRSDDGGRTWQLLNDGFNMTVTAVLLRPHLRRPAGRRHRLHLLREVLLQVDRRREDLHRSADAALRLSRPLDRPEGSSADGERQRRRRLDHVQRRADVEHARQSADGAVLRRRHRQQQSRTGSTDHSRTTRPSRSPAGRAAPASPRPTGIRSPAARAATSRRRRRTRPWCSAAATSA